MVTNKEKTESGNYFFVRVVYNTKPRLIAMSTNLEYRERERERQRLKRESGRQASEAQREKERQRARARDK